MATIVTLQPWLEKSENKPRKQVLSGAGHVIIFSGVRYEKIPETSINIAKTGKKTLKTA